MSNSCDYVIPDKAILRLTIYSVRDILVPGVFTLFVWSPSNGFYARLYFFTYRGPLIHTRL